MPEIWTRMQIRKCVSVIVISEEFASTDLLCWAIANLLKARGGTVLHWEDQQG